MLIISPEVLQNLNMARDLLSSAVFASLAVNVIRNEFIATTRLVVNEDFASSQFWHDGQCCSK